MEDQWDAVSTAWLAQLKNGVSKRKLGAFVEKYCDNNNLPYPKKLSLTHRIQHKKDKNDAGEQKCKYFLGCCCFIDEELIAALDNKLDDSYKPQGMTKASASTATQNTKYQKGIAPPTPISSRI